MSIHAKPSPALHGVTVNVSSIGNRGAFLWNSLISYEEAAKLRDELSAALAGLEEPTRIQCVACRKDKAECRCAGQTEGRA